MKNILPIVFLLIVYGCQQKPTDKLEIRIIQQGGSQCHYRFVVDENRLIYSNISFDNDDIFCEGLGAIGPETYDTLMNDVDTQKVRALFAKIPAVIKKGTGHDTYDYSVLKNGTLLYRAVGQSLIVLEIMDVIRPYIIEKRIQCNPFFILFDHRGE